MQPDALARVAMALASTGISTQELEKILWGSPNSQLQVVEGVRLIRQTTIGNLRLSYEAADIQPNDAGVQRPNIQAVAAIDRILRQEVGLSAAQAVQELTTRIKQKNNKAVIPPYTKNSFVDWLERLLRYIPSSEILHLAARIQNEQGGATPSEQSWHLRKPT